MRRMNWLCRFGAAALGCLLLGLGAAEAHLLVLDNEAGDLTRAPEREWILIEAFQENVQYGPSSGDLHIERAKLRRDMGVSPLRDVAAAGE